MRVRALVAALGVVVCGAGAAHAVAVPAVGTGASSQTRYGCGGVDPIGGVCIDSPLDTLDGPLDTVEGVLR